MIKDCSSLDFRGVDEKFQACQSYFSWYDFQILRAEREEIVIFQMPLAFPPTSARCWVKKVNVLDAHLGERRRVGDIQTLRWHSYGMLHWIPAQPKLRLNSKKTHMEIWQGQEHSHSLIINPSLGMYHEIHSFGAMKIDSVKINTSLIIVRKRPICISS